MDTGTASALTQETADIVPTSVDSAQLATDYQATLAAGRDETFAKAGDSNTEMHFSIYGVGCRGDLNLSSASSALQATVNKFRKTTLPVGTTQGNTHITCPWINNSFNRFSAASRSMALSTQPLTLSKDVPRANTPGFGALYVRDNGCSSDTETTLACEIRLTNARYTLIGGGSNDIGWDSNPSLPALPPKKERFEDLVQEARDNASIPILQTIPAIESATGEADVTAANLVKIEAMNQAILDVAAEQKVPVINLWRGLQTLPRKGLSRDGIHLSHSPEGGTSDQLIQDGGDLSDLATRTYGANARSKFVLETLAFLEGQLGSAPPTAINYDSISIPAADVTHNSAKVSLNVSGSFPPGATTILTKSTTPRGTASSQSISPAIGANSFTLTGLQESTTYYVRAITTWGSPQQKVASSEISVSTKVNPSTPAFTKPTTTVLTPDPSAGENRTTVKFNFTSGVNGPGLIGSGGTTFRCSLDNAAFTDCLPPMTYSDLSVGSHLFIVQSNNQGVWGQIASDSFMVDGPNVTISSGPAEGSVSSNTSPSFTSTSTGSAKVNGITYTLKKNGNVLFSGTSSATKSFTGLGDGDYEFTTNWEDPNGYSDPEPPVRKWRIEAVDTTPPNVTFTYPVNATERNQYPREDWPSNNNDPVLVSQSTESTVLGGVYFWLKKDGSLYDQGFWGPSKSFTDLPDGDYEFTTNWQDTAGNNDPTPPVRKWTIDTVAPNTTINSGPANGSTSNNHNPTFGFSSNDPDAFLECRIWQGWVPPDYTTCASPKTYSGLANGVWVIQVRARDRAGNIDATVETRSWTITP